MIPKIAHPLDTSNFRSIEDDEEPCDTELKEGEDPTTNPFKDFTPISRPQKQLNAL